MSKNLPYVLHVMKETGLNMKNKTSDFFKGLFHSNTKSTKNYKSRTKYSVPNRESVGARKTATGKPIAGATQHTVRVSTVASRPRNNATSAGVASVEKAKAGFRFSKLLNPKRVGAIAAAALAAVLIPVIAVSANGNADNSLPIVNQESNFTQKGQPGAPDELNVKGTIVSENDQTDNTAETGQPVPTAGTGEVCEDAPLDEVESLEVVAQPTPEPKQYLNLVPEEENPDVAKLQQRLMDLYYLEIDEPTNLYGTQTQLAVSYFQRKHGLAVDGVAGETTQDLLFSDEAKPYSVTTEAEGPDVELIQGQLEKLGYDVGVTGYFGTETENAVKYFQRMNGLDDDGSVGQYTKELMFSDEAEPSVEYWEEKEAEESKESSSDASSEKKKKKESSGGGSTSHTADPGNAQAFVDAAVAQQGKTYVRGGKGPDVFDCSGLVYYALNASGNNVGYMTSGGWASSGYPTINSISDLQIGDVICFTGHVGVYMGGGTMVDASSSKGQVVIRGMGSWAHSNFICGKRPL